MINVTEEKEAYHDEERNHQVDRAARSEHRNSNSHSPRSNILLGLLDRRRQSISAAFFLCHKALRKFFFVNYLQYSFFLLIFAA